MDFMIRDVKIQYRFGSMEVEVSLLGIIRSQDELLDFHYNDPHRHLYHVLIPKEEYEALLTELARLKGQEQIVNVEKLKILL
jgi:hypothetical protein